jgi:RNA polymerase sigma factor (sigma-70 family)
MKAAGFAIGRAAKLKPVWGYSWDDMHADAMLGAWGACDAAHNVERHYLNLMALCGYRRIIDARRVQYRINAIFTGEGFVYEQNDSISDRSPHGDFSALELVQHIERLPEPYPTLARLLVEGLSLAEIGEQLGVSESRVSQRRSELQRLLKRHESKSH